ncbi:MAG: ECF transporter S component [Firmicutes bacterium]|nr:ECF transporter S component [Bacillota bacterium]
MREEVKLQVRGKRFWELLTARRSLRLILFVFLSLVGSMIRLPLPMGSVALETFPGYFAALSFGWVDGGLVAGLSHLLVSALGGFPLGIWLHFLAGLQMALWAVCFCYINDRVGMFFAIIAITILHSLVSVVYTLPIWNMVIFSGLLLPLATAAAVNLSLAGLLFLLGARKRSTRWERSA